MAYSINDALNCFGSATGASGTLPDQIYVGNLKSPPPMVNDGRGYAQGGEVKIPYFVKFTAGGTIPTGDVTLTVEGAPDSDVSPAAGDFKVVGRLVVPGGEWTRGGEFRVAVSDTKAKYFRAVYAGALAATTMTAFLGKE